MADDATASLESDGVRYTVSGGGFSDGERAAILASLASGQVAPHQVPPGDGSKVRVTIAGIPPAHEVPLWAAETGDAR